MVSVRVGNSPDTYTCDTLQSAVYISNHKTQETHGFSVCPAGHIRCGLVRLLHCIEWLEGELRRALNEFKVHIPPISAEYMLGELKNILIAGVHGNSRTELCDDAEAADYVFVDFRHLLNQGVCITHPEKTAIIDYRDQPQSIFSYPAMSYFKRSVVNPTTGEFLQYDREVYPISYCVKDAYYRLEYLHKASRDIDIAVFFDATQVPEKARDYYRTTIARLIKSEFGELKIFVGISGNNGKVGRNQFQQSYFELMTRSKIVVTCNPDRCEGDYRLFEALSSGSLVISDNMITPVINQFVDGEHLVYYDKNELEKLVDSIRRLLANDAERTKIAANGYKHAMQFHCTTNRIDEILEIAKHNVKFGFL